MSNKSAEFGRDKIKPLRKVTRYFDSQLPDPFMAMSFLSLLTIAEIRITDRGLIDSKNFEILDFFVK